MSVVVCGGTFRHARRFGPCWGACGITDSAIISALSWTPYYAPIQICTNCGDMWEIDGMYPRPFQRGWRQKSIKQAIARWDNACDCVQRQDDEGYLLPCEHQKVEP